MQHTIVGVTGASHSLDKRFFMNGIVVAPPPPGERSSFYYCAWRGTGKFNCLELLRRHVDSKDHQRRKQRKFEMALKFAGGYPQGVSLQENLIALCCPQ